MSKFNLPPEQNERLRALGEPIATFRAKLIGLWITIGLGFLVGLALGVGLPVFLLNRMEQKGWSDVLGDILSLFVNVGVVILYGVRLIVAVRGGMRRLRRNKGLRVFAFRDGLARVQGDSAEVVRWQDITTIRRTVRTHEDQEMEATHWLVLTAVNGKEFEFDDSLSGLKRLRQLVEQYTLPYLFPSVLKACQAGSEYVFGAVKVNSKGLAYATTVNSNGFTHTKQLPWAQCASIEVTKGVLVVKKKGAWTAFCKVLVGFVPNVHVLIAYAEHVRKSAE